MQARRFLTRWSFYSSIVIRDLTLRSAQRCVSDSLLFFRSCFLATVLTIEPLNSTFLLAINIRPLHIISFGSFHLLRLLYDEYIIYLVELIDMNPDVSPFFAACLPGHLDARRHLSGPCSPLLATVVQNAEMALLSVPAGCTRAMVEDYEPRPSVIFGGAGGGGSGKRNGSDLEPSSMKAPSECERRQPTVPVNGLFNPFFGSQGRGV